MPTTWFSQFTDFSLGARPLVRGPGSAVVIPSVLSPAIENWGREFGKFAPSIEVRTYYGGLTDRSQQRAELMADRGKWNVCITTYNIAQGNELDRKFLKRIEWEVRRYAVL